MSIAVVLGLGSRILGFQVAFSGVSGGPACYCTYVTVAYNIGFILRFRGFVVTVQV